MTSIEQTLKNEYREALSKCKFSDKRRLYKLYEAPKRTTVSRKIIISYAVLAAAIMLLLLTGAAAAYTLYDAVAFRTKDLDMTDEKREEMVENLEEWNTTPEEFATGTADLGVNKYGETYGTLLDGVDLYSVSTSVNDVAVTGYCYREDYLHMGIDNSILTHATQEEIDSRLAAQRALEEGRIRNWVYVYNEDGDMILGKFIVNYNTTYDNMYYSYGFVTNEQLESDDVFVNIIDGEDGAEYKEMAEERLAEKTK